MSSALDTLGVQPLRTKRHPASDGATFDPLTELPDANWLTAAVAAPISARVGPVDSAIELEGGTALRVDGTGRWLSSRFAGRFFRRTLDGRVVTYPEPRAAPVDLERPELLHRSVRILATELAQAARNPKRTIPLSGVVADRNLLVEMLQRAATWTADGYEELRRRFWQAYDEPPEILPPDRYLDAVVLPATGCPNAGCTFCAFYRGRRLQPKTREAFRAHLEAVVELFGPALALRTGIFLGSASALSLSQRRLLEVIDDTRNKLGERTRGMAGFWDVDHSPQRTTAEWNELVATGLRGVYVGLESGCASLRAEVGKSGDLDTVARKLRGARAAAGLRLGLIVLAGLGGAARANEHITHTAQLIGQLGLSSSDIVYVSPLAETMGDAELEANTSELRLTIAASTPAQVASYAMHAFRYYA